MICWAIASLPAPSLLLSSGFIQVYTSCCVLRLAVIEDASLAFVRLCLLLPEAAFEGDESDTINDEDLTRGNSANPEWPNRSHPNHWLNEIGSYTYKGQFPTRVNSVFNDFWH